VRALFDWSTDSMTRRDQALLDKQFRWLDRFASGTNFWHSPFSPLFCSAYFWAGHHRVSGFPSVRAYQENLPFSSECPNPVQSQNRIGWPTPSPLAPAFRTARSVNDRSVAALRHQVRLLVGRRVPNVKIHLAAAVLQVPAQIARSENQAAA